MLILLKRLQCGKDGTIGTLYVNGCEECIVLEDVDRMLEIADNMKINGESCIPRGNYEVIINFSNRFKKEMPLLLNVPRFEGVRIHAGNYTGDTEGCLLLGSSYIRKDDKPMILNSRATYDKFFAKLDASLQLGERCWIEII